MAILIEVWLVTDRLCAHLWQGEKLASSELDCHNSFTGFSLELMP